MGQGLGGGGALRCGCLEMEAGLRDEGVAQAVSTWLAITRP
jgi:hypothetical protein